MRDPLGESRRRDGDEGFLKQQRGLELGPTAAPVPDGAIDILGIEIDRAGGRGDRDLDQGMGGLEGRQVRDQPMRGEGGDGADAQSGPAVAQRLHGGLDPLQRVAHGGQHGFPVLGQHRTAAPHLDEGNAEQRFEVGDAVRERRPRNAEFTGGGRQRAFARERLEGLQAADRRQAWDGQSVGRRQCSGW